MKLFAKCQNNEKMNLVDIVGYILITSLKVLREVIWERQVTKSLKNYSGSLLDKIITF